MNERPGVNADEKSVEENIVENKALGLRYKETTTELPEHRRKLTGIRRVVRKEILESPISKDPRGPFYSGKSEEAYNLEVENWPVLDYLTDNRYTSFKTWNHSLLGDAANDTPKSRKKLTDFKSEMYFQAIDPSLLPGSVLSVGYGPILWVPKGTPVFFFGNRNPRFVYYIRKILETKDIADSLKTGAYKKGYKDSYFGNWDDWKSEFREINPQKDLDPSLGDAGYEYMKKAGVKILEDPPSGLIRNLDNLRYLAKGEPFISSNIARLHPMIPVVDHPEVPKLRWCHAEYALIPTQRSLNVLQFVAD